MSKLFAPLLLVVSSQIGCVAPVGSRVQVPEDAATTCSEQCSNIGLTMTAVAIMANNVGCVCQPRTSSTSTTSTSAHSAAAAGGMVTLMIQEQAQQQNQSSQMSR